MRSPTPLFVALSEVDGPFGTDAEQLAVAFDDFFECAARRYPNTGVVLLVRGDGYAEAIAAVRARARGAFAVRVMLERSNETSRWEAFIEKHCPVVLAADVQNREWLRMKRHARVPFRFRVGASSMAGLPLPHDDATLAVLDEIDEWNADVSADVAFDESLCLKTFARADAMAVRAQRHTHHAVDRVFWFTVCSGLSLQIYDHLADFLPAWGNAATPFALVFVAFILAAVVTVRRIHAAEVQRNFQDRRSFAEGLRVQCALLEAGIDINVADRYPAEAGEGIEWIRRAIDAAYLAFSIATGSVVDAEHAEPMMREKPEWISEQCAYYAHASAYHRKAAAWSNRVAVGWLRLSILAAILVAVDGFVRLITHFGVAHFFAETDRYSKPALLMTLAVAGSLAALTKGKTALRGHRVLAGRYAAMHEMFADAARALDQTNVAASPEARLQATRVVVDLAHETLAENAEWHASMRSRPLQSIWSS